MTTSTPQPITEDVPADLQVPSAGRLVLSAGMKSAGSGWYFNLTNDLLVAAGNTHVRTLRKQRGLEGVLANRMGSIDSFERWRLDRLRDVARLGETFAIKTHRGPNKSVRRLIELGEMKATYIFRDPRDAIVSAFDRGRKRRANAKSGSFAKLTSVNVAVLWMRWKQLPRYDAWKSAPGTLMVRYEDLLADPSAEAFRLVRFLGLDVAPDDVDRIVRSYQGEAARTQQGAHYRAGGGRRRDALSPAQLKRCNRTFGRFLREMGYPT